MLLKNRFISAVVIILCTAFLILFLSGCPGPNNPAGTAVTGVSLDKATLAIAVGGTGQLTAAVDTSLSFIRRWKEVFGGIPDWEIYDTVSFLARGPELADRKREQDSLFCLT